MSLDEVLSQALEAVRWAWPTVDLARPECARWLREGGVETAARRRLQVTSELGSVVRWDVRLGLGRVLGGEPRR